MTNEKTGGAAVISEGYEVGDICNRNGCTGIMAEHEADGGCSCHINPPCSHCVDDRHYCPKCNWQGIDDQKAYGTANREQIDYYKKMNEEWDRQRNAFYEKYRSGEPVEKLEYRIEPHTHFSQIALGMYPESMTSADVLQQVKGTFGGRFERFGNGRFKYIAYTD